MVGFSFRVILFFNYSLSAKLPATAPRLPAALPMETAQPPSAEMVPAAASSDNAPAWNTAAPDWQRPPVLPQAGAIHRECGAQTVETVRSPQRGPILRRLCPIPLRAHGQALLRASLRFLKAAVAPAPAPASAAPLPPAAPDFCWMARGRAGSREWWTSRGSKPARAKAAAKFFALRPGSEFSAPALPPAWDGFRPTGRAAVSSPAA